MCNFIITIATGVIAGLISGFIVNWFCQKAINKKNKESEFKLDVQNYSKYITNIIKVLEINKHTEFEQSILVAISSRPLTYSFDEKYLNESKLKCLKEIKDILVSIENYINRQEDINYYLEANKLKKLQIKFLDEFKSKN